MKQIKVRLVNGQEELFPYYVLDYFIKKKGITAFERADGWVQIGRDPVRTKSGLSSFSGPGKRFTDNLVKRRITDRIL